MRPSPTQAWAAARQATREGFNPRAREERDATLFNPLITKPKNPHFREPDLDARAN